MKINKFNEYERLYEGAWGSGPLDNDAASDWKWVFGRFIFNEIKSSFEINISKNELQNLYHDIGMWEYFRDRHADESYGMFTKDQIQELDSLSVDCAEMMIPKVKGMGWKDKKSEQEVVDYLESIINKMI